MFQGFICESGVTVFNRSYSPFITLSTTDVQRMYNGCTTDVQRMYNEGTTDVEKDIEL